MRVLRCEHWPLDKALIRGLLTATEQLREQPPQTQATKWNVTTAQGATRSTAPPFRARTRQRPKPAPLPSPTNGGVHPRLSRIGPSRSQTLQPRKSGSGRKSALLMFIFAAAQVFFL